MSTPPISTPPPPATGARRAASPLLILTRRRQSRCSVATDPSASPPTAATSLLFALPFELLIRIISLLPCAVDVAWTAAVSRVFRDSLADEGMRLREQEGGYEVPNAPEGECPKKWRLFVALTHDANRHQRIAAGSAHSIFVDEHARLSSCGKVLPAALSPPPSAACLSSHRRRLSPPPLLSLPLPPPPSSLQPPLRGPAPSVMSPRPAPSSAARRHTSPPSSGTARECGKL